MKTMIRLLPLFLFMTVLSACDKDDDNGTPAPAIINFAATLNGASEVPANNSSATGTTTGTFNTTTKILTLSTTYAGITVTAGHVHKGEPGVSGGVEFPFSVTPSPILFTSPALSASEEQDLLENKYYVNLHSAAYPDGEIRGQLVKQ